MKLSDELSDELSDVCCEMLVVSTVTKLLLIMPTPRSLIM